MNDKIKPGSYPVIKVAPEIKAIIAAAAKKTGQPEYMVMDILLKTGGYKEGMTADDLTARVNKVITQVLLKHFADGIGAAEAAL